MDVRSYTARQDQQKRTHPRNNESGTGFQNRSRRFYWTSTDTYGYAMRRDEEHKPRTVLKTDIPRKGKRGRPKTRWKDACQRNLKNTRLRAGEEMDRATWSRKISSHSLYDGKTNGKM